MEYKKQNLTKYLDDLSAKLAAPGGGSAAALNAAMGASLISMVVNFTLGKPRYAAFEAELKQILAKSEKLRNDFLELVDLDVVAYQSKDLRKALDVPLMLARLCCEAAKLCPPLIKKGNLNLITDVAIAAVFLESAFVSACFNVEINLKSLDQKKLAQGIKKELGQKIKVIQRIRKDVEDSVGKVIRG
ncbi:MAG: cyclodeaminase/cyclohydrolase family protein [Candidatus Omnitrophica bacterium]|jgi:formiminotetrahydrofolate cyclodeaminase|nr:cyclodeaminase/cyclohydrolase family protein [Candidatus Omnitrophota bacterium]MDD5252748.1 cyclodeaminase/cyclohydrolase family protein [Candidatus Omnitrophota bacterium]